MPETAAEIAEHWFSRQTLGDGITVFSEPLLEAFRANMFLVEGRDRDMVVKLFDELGLRYAICNGGYLCILKCGFRDGDNAPMAFVELVDRPEQTEAVEVEESAGE